MAVRDDWTVAEAEAALPRVRRILAAARATATALADAEAQLLDLRIVWGDPILAPACPGHAEWLRYQDEHRRLREEMRRHLLAFADVGCEPKDIATGLVDFRGRMGDRTVCLCWRDGEPAIHWWHPLETGFAGRQPLPRP